MHKLRSAICDGRNPYLQKRGAAFAMRRLSGRRVLNLPWEIGTGEMQRPAKRTASS
jgi:hypothetical protein